MFGGVPAERGDAVARLDSEAPQSCGEALHTGDSVRKGCSNDLCSIKGGHLAVPEDGCAVMENRLDRQLTVLHGASHSSEVYLKPPTICKSWLFRAI